MGGAPRAWALAAANRLSLRYARARRRTPFGRRFRRKTVQREIGLISSSTDKRDRSSKGQLAPPRFHLALSDRDQLSRKLRISLVDHCNFRCFFCHNEGQGALGQHRVGLSPDQIEALCEAALQAGVREIKLTGGEPLLYRHSGAGVLDVVRRIAALRRRYVFGLSMTTNGVLLERYAQSLGEAGLDRVTISLHTLRADTLQSAVGVRVPERELERVLNGIEAARGAGLSPLKMNTVLFAAAEGQPGNLDEVAAIAQFCRQAGFDELRLYSLLAHEGFMGPQFRRRYRFWDRPTLEALAGQLTDDPRSAGAITAAATRFVDRWRRTLYPKATLHLQVEGLSVAIEAMEHGRFAAAGLSAEGAYALRLSANGLLRGALEGERARPLLGLLRSGSNRHVLVREFAEARATLLPGESVSRANI